MDNDLDSHAFINIIGDIYLTLRLDLAWVGNLKTLLKGGLPTHGNSYSLSLTNDGRFQSICLTLGYRNYAYNDFKRESIKTNI